MTNPLPRLLRGLVRRRRRAARPKRSTPLRVVLERFGLLPSPPEGSEYHAFISYSHHADDRLAPAIERGLQRFAKPWYQARALRIFRDESSLSTDPGLWSAIARGIDSSEHLIVLASEDAAKSEWCGKEVAHWCSRNGSNNILIVLSSGEIEWDGGKGDDFDWERTTALPRTVRGVFKEQPRYTDMRWAHSGTDLSLSHGRFRDAIAELAAPLHGVRKDEIAGEEVRQHRRTIRIVRTAILLLLGLTALAVGAAVLAYLARNDAIKQRRNAVSRVLAVQSGREMKTSLGTGALTAIAAYREQATPEAMSSLVNAVQQTESVERVLRASGTAAPAASWSADGRLVTADSRGLGLWEPRTGAFQRLPGAGADEVVVSRDGTLVASMEDGVVRVRRLATPGGTSLAMPRGARSIHFVPGSDALAIGTADGRVLLWKAGAGIVARVPVHPGAEISSIGFGRDGRTLVAAAGSFGLAVVRLDLRGSVVRSTYLKPSVAFDDVAVGQGGLLVALDAFNRVLIWKDDHWIGAGVVLVKDVAAVAVSPRGIVATGDAKGTVRLWRPVAGSAAIGEQRFDDTRISHLAFDTDGATLASTSADGAVVLWRASGASFVHPIAGLAADGGARFLSRQTIVAASGGSVALRTRGAGSTRELPQAPDEILGLAVPDYPQGDRSPDTVAVRAPDSVVLWTGARSTATRFVFRRRYASPAAVALSRDGALLAQGTDRGTVDIWPVASPGSKPVSIATGGSVVVGLAFDSGGRYLAAGRLDGKVVVIDRATKAVVATPRERGTEVDAIAFSPQEDLLAFGSWSGKVTLWNLRTRAVRSGAARTTGSRVMALAFAPDGKTVAWSDLSGNVAFWDVEHDSLIAEIPVSDSRHPVVSLQFTEDGTRLLAARGQQAFLLDNRLWSAARAIDRLCALFGAAGPAAEPLQARVAGLSRPICRQRTS